MARNVWSDHPLGVKLAALVAAGAVVLAVFAVLSVQALRGTGARTDELLATTHATGAALEADMMHDAVRGDVLQAMLAGAGPEYAAAVADLAEHGGTFRDSLAAVDADELGGDVHAAVSVVGPVVEDYLATAQRIVVLAGQDPAQARAAYPEFAAAFSALEDALPNVGDAVARHATAAAEAAADQRSSATTLAVVVAVGGVLVLAVLGRLVTRSVVRPLQRVGAVLAAMADGDLLGGLPRRGAKGLVGQDLALVPTPLMVPEGQAWAPGVTAGRLAA